MPVGPCNLLDKNQEEQNDGSTSILYSVTFKCVLCFLLFEGIIGVLLLKDYSLGSHKICDYRDVHVK